MRFSAILAVAALGSTAYAQVASSLTSAAGSAASSVASSVRSSTSTSSSSSSTSASTTSSSGASVVTVIASAGASSSSSNDDDDTPTTTRVYTTTYYYITHNPTRVAVSPTLLIESVVRSTSGLSNQQSFSTPTGSITVLTLSRSTYTTTFTSENPIHAAQSQYYTITQTITTTNGLPNTSSTSDGAAGKVGAKGIGGFAAFVLGVAGMYL